ncbi:flagellar hook-basal body complex protein FliE [Brevundimonas sp. NPDC003935]|jgi:flagellar hook-basal body complex protein FliE|uniref:Flagellar hook-basal body complex protein FliE n=1 Tax=Brevundimonas bullata TaxID=13160 RepID=A0A7W7ILL0_9CAUL|nr:MULTISPECIES: flagellar hook-basal body complex protein FliE [Brevundimonas]MBB4796378.1 flagellar hook-basal body complex protein FliE [Brevundimonas bullata]MBB6381338.1 flagellar hook-basal body complex protein FliE [Brevundimonas bullata]
MNPMMAAKAYAAVQGGAMPTATPPSAASAAQGPGFSELLQNVMTQTAQQTRGAETQMAQMVQGQGSLIDVVTAVSSAEASLETVMAVRDQVISAYQEIMRMPI